MGYLKGQSQYLKPIATATNSRKVALHLAPEIGREANHRFRHRRLRSLVEILLLGFELAWPRFTLIARQPSRRR